MIHRSHRRSIKSSFRDKVHYKLRNTTIITHSSYSKFIRVTTPPGFDCRCWKKYSRRIHLRSWSPEKRFSIFKFVAEVSLIHPFSFEKSLNRASIFLSRSNHPSTRSIRLEQKFRTEFRSPNASHREHGTRRRKIRSRNRNFCECIYHPCVDDDRSQSANKIMELLRKEIGMNVIRIFQSRHPYSRPCPTISGH